MDRKRDWPVGINALFGISCALALAVIYLGYVGTGPIQGEAAATRTMPAPAERKRPVRAMNLALGDMVYFAQDLGFRVSNGNGDEIDASKIAARIENQLQGIRELYRREIAKDSALSGTFILAFNVDPSGAVTQPREISSRLTDAKFKRAVAAEMSKWSFAEVTGEDLEITCPLLFVHEGMDITTLVQWEKALGQPIDQPAAARRTDKTTQSSAATVAKLSAVPVPAPAGREYQMKYGTSLRRNPNFSAPTLTSLSSGTRVTALGKQGDWLEVRPTGNGPTGFVRKEFVTAVDVRQK